MDKDFQVAILKELVDTYPGHALEKFPALLAMCPGETERAKRNYLYRHLKALEAFGYLEDVAFRRSVDGYISCNAAFSITEQGLLAAGVDLLHPDPYQELREVLLEQAQVLRDLSVGQKTTLTKVLAQLPRVALERLRDKGLDALLALLF